MPELPPSGTLMPRRLNPARESDEDYKVKTVRPQDSCGGRYVDKLGGQGSEPGIELFCLANPPHDQNPLLFSPRFNGCSANRIF